MKTLTICSKCAATGADTTGYNCKHMACEDNEEPCYSCTYLNNYEEDTDEQS